ncbi:Aminoglycoside 6-adenylyltransferase [Bacillus subtilis]|nr:Aminoglycoside 6-adenylyltransferase [Bacillus subtilis]
MRSEQEMMDIFLDFALNDERNPIGHFGRVTYKQKYPS